MTIGEHLTEFGGLKVESWEPAASGTGLEAAPNLDYANTIQRISCEYDDKQSWVEKFRALLSQPNIEQTQGLVVGWWGTEDSEAMPTEIIEALVSAQAQLPKLNTLFFGDVTYEENEVSWIQNTDLSPILAAYPKLVHFGVRGGNNLALGNLDSNTLKTLIIQAGGLDVSVVREVMNAKLPNLEHLELYLGTEDYGANSSVDDLTPILDGTLFPKLKYLGLKNSDYEDQIAQVIANAPLLIGLEVLDLAMGTLTDEGAAALLTSDKVKGLKKLDLHHHFCSNEMMEKLKALPIEVDVSDKEGDDDEDGWRYVALGE